MTLAARWKSLARREGFVLLAPDAADRSGWNVPTDGPELLYRLVESLRRRYDIDAGRVYLFGHSAGAVFALYMSLLEPEYFAAAAVHAGALGSEGDPRTVRLARRRIPIAICSGTEDPIFPMTAVRSTVEQLQQSGMPVVVRWMPRHGHEYESRADDINLWAWRFLHEHKLPETPRYTPYEFE